MTYNDCVHFIVCDRCPNCKPSECEFFKNKVDVVEVRHGEWTKVEVTGNGYGQIYYQHKNCTVNSTELYKSAYEYCPHCGAKMGGKDNNVPTTDERSDAE